MTKPMNPDDLKNVIRKLGIQEQGQEINKCEELMEWN
jgi:hypothetical protein